MIRAAAALLCFAASFVGGPARTDEIVGSVLILQMTEVCPDAAYPEAEQALEAELALSSVPSVVSAAESCDIPGAAELARAAANADALSAVRIGKTSEGVTVDTWVRSPDDPSAQIYGRFDASERLDRSGPTIIAVRALETLRSAFFALTMRQPTSSSESPVSPQNASRSDAPTEPPTNVGVLVRSVSTRRPERFLFGLGLAGNVGLSPGSAGTRGAFSLHGNLRPLRGLELEASVLWSPLGPDVTTTLGISSFSYLLARGWLRYRFFEGARFQPSVGIGAGGFFGHLEGIRPTDESVSDFGEARARTAYLGGSARLFFYPQPRLALFLEAAAGALLPEAVLEHVDIVAARFGRPLIEIHLGLELRFWSV